MSHHRASIRWTRQTPGFEYDTYDRSHQVTFEGGTTVQASSAPEYLGRKELVNPEEMLVAALSNCHMLTFLAIAARSRVVVNSYEDHAEGLMEKGPDGKISITQTTLRPKVVFADPQPDWTRVEHFHEKAHANCFIANSVKTEVRIEPVK